MKKGGGTGPETLATCQLLREGEGAKSDPSTDGKDKLQVVF